MAAIHLISTPILGLSILIGLVVAGKFVHINCIDVPKEVVNMPKRGDADIRAYINLSCPIATDTP